MKTTCGLDTISKTCGFHLGFHWVSKLMHVTNLLTNFIGYQMYELLMSLRTINLIVSLQLYQNAAFSYIFYFKMSLRRF